MTGLELTMTDIVAATTTPLPCGPGISLTDRQLIMHPAPAPECYGRDNSLEMAPSGSEAAIPTGSGAGCRLSASGRATRTTDVRLPTPLLPKHAFRLTAIYVAVLPSM